jgi:hypothetical protein
MNVKIFILLISLFWVNAIPYSVFLMNYWYFVHGVTMPDDILTMIDDEVITRIGIPVAVFLSWIVMRDLVAVGIKALFTHGVFKATAFLKQNALVFFVTSDRSRRGGRSGLGGVRSIFSNRFTDTFKSLLLFRKVTPNTLARHKISPLLRILKGPSRGRNSELAIKTFYARKERGTLKKKRSQS